MWSAEKPSNIALIKYMGKLDSDKNKPTNSSLSWTLDHLYTSVVIEKSVGAKDEWAPLDSNFPFPMSEAGREKYLNHFRRLKKYFGVKDDHYSIRSGNNFPADCGIASSASSFAALTEAACLALSELTGKEISRYEKANLSSLGSGSSCRSFLPGWVLWNGNEIKAVDTEIPKLHHMVVIVGGGTKKVSSSQAHKRVASSLLFRDRVERAGERLQNFILSSQNLNWERLYQISWEEFWDMHALFETSRPSFGYFLPGTLEVLFKARDLWETRGDGPLVTMDAGPNVHLLWRDNQADLALEFHRSEIKGRWTCLTNINEVGFDQI